MHARSIALLALVVAFIAACGGAAATPTAPPPTAAPATPTAVPATPTAPPPTQANTASLEVVIAAADATIAKKTSAIEQTVTFNGNSQVPTGTSASIIGATAFTEPMQLMAAADFSALGIGTFDMTVDGNLIYLKGKLVEKLTGAGKWLLVDVTSTDPRAAGFKSVASGQNDSSLLLYFVYGGEDPVAVLPDETIDGQVMRHYSLKVDVDAAAMKAPEVARERLATNAAALKAGGMQGLIQGEVWVGTDGLVHRLDYTYTPGAASGGGTMLVKCLFTKLGEPLDLGIPADKDIVKLEDV